MSFVPLWYCYLFYFMTFNKSCFKNIKILLSSSKLNWVTMDQANESGYAHLKHSHGCMFCDFVCLESCYFCTTLKECVKRFSIKISEQITVTSLTVALAAFFPFCFKMSGLTITANTSSGGRLLLRPQPCATWSSYIKIGIKHLYKEARWFKHLP